MRRFFFCRQLSHYKLYFLKFTLSTGEVLRKPRGILDPLSFVTASLYIVFLAAAFLGAIVESKFNKELKSRFPFWLTISEIYANSIVTKWILAVLMSIAAILTAPVIYRYTRCNKNVITSTLFAALTSVCGFITLLTLKWVRADSIIHYALAFAAFSFGVLMLFSAADSTELYVISCLSLLGLVMTIATASQTTYPDGTPVAVGACSRGFFSRYSTWSALGETILVGATAAFFMVIAYDFPPCTCCKDPKKIDREKKES